MGGGQKQLTSLYINKDGSNKALNNVYANINSSSKEIFSSGTPISQIAPGTIISFDTSLSGSMVSTDFIVLGPSQAKDTTLILQKRVYEYKAWDARSNHVVYDGSDIDTYLSSTNSNSYRSKLSTKLLNALVKTNIESFLVSSQSMSTLKRDIFLISYAELGGTTTGSITSQLEGQSYLSALCTAYNTTNSNTAREGEGDYTSPYWTRSAYNYYYVHIVDTSGEIDNTNYANSNQTSIGSYSLYLRPILSINSNYKI